MKGLDAVVLTGGIGEHVREVKSRLAKELSPVIGRKCAFLTIPTNEELLIAQDTYKLVNSKEKK